MNYCLSISPDGMVPAYKENKIRLPMPSTGCFHSPVVNDEEVFSLASLVALPEHRAQLEQLFILFGI
jgi:hypothetical protein